MNKCFDHRTNVWYPDHEDNGKVDCPRCGERLPVWKWGYVVREPGMSAWWQGTRKAEAERELRKARAAGLANAVIVRDSVTV